MTAGGSAFQESCFNKLINILAGKAVALPWRKYMGRKTLRAFNERTTALGGINDINGRICDFILRVILREV